MAFAIWCEECDEALFENIEEISSVTQEILDNHNNVCSANDEDED
jgi:hypothetical protein